MATPTEAGFFESFDRLKLFYRYYDAGGAEDTLVILHGHGEHAGRYEKFADILKGERLRIAAYDFRGHGKSEGTPAYINHYEDYVKDVSSFVRFLEDQSRLNGKFFLLGHSVGGLVAVDWAARYPEKIKALFLSSPCLGLKLPAVLIKLNQVLNRFAPKFYYQNPVYPPHLTHNPEEILHYKKDALIQRKMSVRLVHELLSGMNRLESVPRFDFSFPVYILDAGLEKVVDARKTELFFSKIHAPAKEMKVFPDFYHEIFNELGQEKAFDALKACIAGARAIAKSSGA